MRYNKMICQLCNQPYFITSYYSDQEICPFCIKHTSNPKTLNDNSQTQRTEELFDTDKKYTNFNLSDNRNIGVFSNLETLKKVVNDLSHYKINFPDPATEIILNNPYQAYLKALINSNCPVKVIERVKKYKPASFFQDEQVELKDFEKEIERILTELVKPYNDKYGTFPSLNRREYRYLSRYYDFPKKDKITYIKFLEKIIDEDKISSRIFSNLIEVYFAKYNSFINNDDLYLQIARIWNIYENKNTRRNNWLDQLIKNKQYYLSKEAPKKIALSTLNLRKNKPDLNIHEIMKININNILGDLLFESYKYIGMACLEKCNDEFYLDILLNEILSNSPISKKELDEIVSNIILAFADESEINASLQKKIKKNLLCHESYGDPRIKAINWNNVDPKALTKFRTWLTKDDIEFFFNLLIDDISDSQGRKPFWLKYVGSIINSRVIISNTHRTNKRSQLLEAENEGKVFSSLNGSNASCFIMDFGKFYAVEFTEKGNALYIYKKNNLDLKLNKTQFNLSELKRNYPKKPYRVKLGDTSHFNISKLDDYNEMCIYHIQSWQSLAEDIFKYLGIYQH